MDKRFAISLAAMFVMFMGLGFLIHATLLAHDYGQVPNLFRTDQDQMNYFPYMLVAHAIAAFAFVWLFRRFQEDTPYLTQGIRYGLAVAALMIVPKFLIYYAVQPMPAITVAKQIVFDTVGLVLMGIVVARLNAASRSPARTAYSASR
jgi:hypothetical protein